MTSVGAIAGGAFKLIAERPGAVLAWGLLYIAVIVGGALLIVQPMLQSGAMMRVGASPGALLAALLPYYLALLLLVLVLSAASYRAMLRPAERSFASLRLGMDEVRLVLLGLALLAIFAVLLFAAGIVIGLVGAVVGAGLAGTGRGGFGFGVVVMLIMTVLIYGTLLFVMIRLSPTAALTILRRKIVIGEAWRITRGNFWRLFGGYLVVGLILFAAYIAATLVTAGPYLAALVQGGFTAQAFQDAGRVQLAQQMGGISPLMILGWILQTVIAAAGFAMWGGAVSTATRGLLGTTADDYAATFA